MSPPPSLNHNQSENEKWTETVLPHSPKQNQNESESMGVTSEWSKGEEVSYLDHVILG